MDDLGRELNEEFDKQQAQLGNLAGTRERLMRGALAAREQGAANRAQLAAGIAAILIAALVIATFAYIRAGSQLSHEGPVRPTPLTRPEGLWPRVANFAYDSTRGQVLIFGGATDAPASNDTWVWDGHGWGKKSSPANPPNLAGAAITDDPDHHVVVLFGGDAVGYYFAETWLWNGSAWNHVFPAHSPSQRTGAAMTYDPVHHVVLLFGGYANGDLNDTWEWDGTDWTKMSPATSPPGRVSARLAFDSARGNAVLFGGFDGLNDTWTWDGGNWTERHPANTPPGLRQANPIPQQMVYDVARRVVVMVDSTQHGAELAKNTMDTWTWDGATWTRLTPATSPNARDGFGLAYDERRSVTVLAGGYPLADLDMVSTWTWDGVNWTGFGTVGPAPSPVATRYPASGVATVDADPLDASTGWILLTNCLPPMAGQCQYSVASTADGGRTWSKAVQVGPSFDPTNGDAPRTIRFINANDGFVYGGSAAFATHDGGRTWGSMGLRSVLFNSIVGRGTTAWLITYPCAKGTVCLYEVQSSADGGKTWSSPHAFPVGMSPFDPVAIGTMGLLVSVVPSHDLELTRDGGATWSFVRTKCTESTFRTLVTTADGNDLWEMCVDSPQGQFTNKQLFVSADGGKTWAVRINSRVSASEVGAESGSLVSPSAGTALVATTQSGIEITHDGGVTWKEVGPHGVGFLYLRFPTQREGWALDVAKNLWSTNDGGDHWMQLTFV